MRSPEDDMIYDFTRTATALLRKLYSLTESSRSVPGAFRYDPDDMIGGSTTSDRSVPSDARCWQYTVGRVLNLLSAERVNGQRNALFVHPAASEILILALVLGRSHDRIARETPLSNGAFRMVLEGAVIAFVSELTHRGITLSSSESLAA